MLSTWNLSEVLLLSALKWKFVHCFPFFWERNYDKRIASSAFYLSWLFIGIVVLAFIAFVCFIYISWFCFTCFDPVFEGLPNCPTKELFRGVVISHQKILAPAFGMTPVITTLMFLQPPASSFQQSFLLALGLIRKMLICGKTWKIGKPVWCCFCLISTQK